MVSIFRARTLFSRLRKSRQHRKKNDTLSKTRDIGKELDFDYSTTTPPPSIIFVRNCAKAKHPDLQSEVGAPCCSRRDSVSSLFHVNYEEDSTEQSNMWDVHNNFPFQESNPVPPLPLSYEESSSARLFLGQYDEKSATEINAIRNLALNFGTCQVYVSNFLVQITSHEQGDTIQISAVVHRRNKGDDKTVGDLTHVLPRDMSLRIKKRNRMVLNCFQPADLSNQEFEQKLWEFCIIAERLMRNFTGPKSSIDQL